MAKHLIVTGKVQGVGYRAWFVEQVRMLGLTGWVRNRGDGSVEAVLAGNPEAVERMLVWARRGPPPARVENVAVSETDLETGTDFAVRPTV